MLYGILYSSGFYKQINGIEERVYKGEYKYENSMYGKSDDVNLWRKG